MIRTVLLEEGSSWSRSRHRPSHRACRRHSQRVSAGYSKEGLRFSNAIAVTNCRIAILAFYSGGLALPEVDPELDTREEPFFDQNSLKNASEATHREARW